MRYLKEDDLKTDSQERFITESTADNVDSPEKNEAKAIDLVITYMSGRYDTDLIFKVGSPLRNELLVDIISKLTLYKIFRRNAARKVSTDIKEDYEWALKELDKINSGRTVLNNLPKPTPTPGEADSDSLWGNNSNTDFYI